MTPDIEPSVQRRSESPEAGTSVRLIVGVDSINTETRAQLRGAGATLHDELPLDYVSVTIAENNLQSLCSLDSVTSVELDGEGTVFESDFPSPPG